MIEQWAIQDENTGLYFSLLGSPHFTDNIEIVCRFKSEADAVRCEEMYIHCEIAFDQYDTLPVKF